MAQVQAITAQLKTAPAQPPEQKAAFPAPEQKTAFDKVRFSYIQPVPLFISLNLGCGSYPFFSFCIDFSFVVLWFEGFPSSTAKHWLFFSGYN